jgi:hypothetical protein
VIRTSVAGAGPALRTPICREALAAGGDSSTVTSTIAPGRLPAHLLFAPFLLDVGQVRFDMTRVDQGQATHGKREHG